MKTKLFLFIILLFAANVLKTLAQGSDTTWTTYHYDGYAISVLGGNLYVGIKSKISIRSDDPNEIYGVRYYNGYMEPISNGWFYVTPNDIGMSTFRIFKTNDTVPKIYNIEVFPIPDPIVYLNADKHHWYKVITMEDILNSSGIVVKNKFNNFELVSFTLSMVDNGEFKCFSNRSDKFDPSTRKALQKLKIGQKFVIEDIKIKVPDGHRNCEPGIFEVIDSYENEFIRRTIKIQPFSNDLGLLKTDLRIKIEGHPKKEDIETIHEFANELNGILENIKVRIVNSQPSLTIIFDSIPDTSANKTGDRIQVRTQSSVFYHFRKEFRMYFNPYDGYESRSRSTLIKQYIYRLLGHFTESMLDLSLLNNSTDLTSYDKYLLKTLYSQGGEDEVKKIINAQYEDPDRSGVFILILIISVCLMFIFSEIYHYYSLNTLLRKIRNKFLVRITESILIAQIPVLAYILLVLINGSNLSNEFGKIPEYELFLIPLFILWGVLFFFLDQLLKTIRINWLNIIIDFVLTVFCVSLAYQIIYLLKTPELINLKNLSWEILIIPVMIALYRLYARFQSKKISGLLQEKELELAKQKELKFKSDLNALQARINPHFLYNALNSLASLAHIDATRTEKMALSLSKLFRYNINKEEKNYSTLSEEIEMTGIYLNIEKNRFEDKMEYRIELQEQLKDFTVPQSILQPLAENAVKHGISKISGKGIIRINIFEAGQKVLIEIYDNGPEFPGGLISGYGLQNTYEKLKLLYKKPFEIEFINQPEKKLAITLTK